MLQRGDYVVPYLNNRYRFDKPPLTYWCQTISYRVFGENDFAARLPSAIAASLTALLLFAWGRRLGTEQFAWWVAIIFTVSLQSMIHAKAAVADMWLVLFMTAAHWAGYELLRDRLSNSALQPSTPNPQPSIFWWWTFYVSLAFAFLAKGPIGLMPLLTVATVRLFLPELRLSRRFLFLTGSAVALSIIAIWGVPALMRTNGDFLRVGIGRHVVGRSLVAMEGHGANSLWSYLATLPFYFAVIFLTFLPWSIKLPWLTKKLWRRRDPLDNYLIAGSAIIFIVFTLVKTKLPHYTLPAFPLLALLLAKALADLPNAERFVRRAAITTGVVALFAMALSPIAARYSPALQLMQQARGDLTREMEFGAIGYREPSLIWYFRRHVDGWMSDLDENSLKPFLERPGGRFAVMPTGVAQKMYPTLPVGWKSYAVQGFNTASGKRVNLTLILKPS